MSDSTRVLTALVAGVAIGLTSRALSLGGSETAAGILQPIGVLWSNAIRLSVIPLVMASIFVAVVKLPQLGGLGRMASVVFAVAVALLALAAFTSLWVGPLVLTRLPIDPETLARLQQTYVSSTASLSAPPTSIADWIGQLLPSNPFKAVAEGTLLPIALATLAFAVAARQVAASKTQIFTQLADSVSEVAFKWIGWMIRVAPVGVFTLVFALSVRSGQGIALALVGYVLATVLLCALIAAVLYALVWLTGIVPIPQFARAALTAQVVGFSSRSSMAALPLMIDAAKNRLALPDEVSQALLPLLVSVFRVTASVVICIGAVFVAWLYGIPLRPDQILTVALLSILLGFAMPGVPGAGVLATAPVLAAIGLPAESVPILLAVDAVGDMFRTATNVTGHLALSVVGSRVLRPAR